MGLSALYDNAIKVYRDSIHHGKLPKTHVDRMMMMKLKVVDEVVGTKSPSSDFHVTKFVGDSQLQPGDPWSNIGDPWALGGGGMLPFILANPHEYTGAENFSGAEQKKLAVEAFNGLIEQAKLQIKQLEVLVDFWTEQKNLAAKAEVSEE